MPGVLLIEAMAQTGGILLLNSLPNFEEKLVFIFGSEDNGIRDLTKKNSDYIFKIPINNIESLNVSNAVTSVLTFYNYLNSNNASKKLL